MLGVILYSIGIVWDKTRVPRGNNTWEQDPIMRALLSLLQVTGSPTRASVPNPYGFVASRAAMSGLYYIRAF